MNFISQVQRSNTRSFNLATKAQISKCTVLAILVAWLYLPILTRMVQQWYTDANYSHGFLVPIFSVWALWHDRERLRAFPARPSTWGVAFLLLAIGVLTVGVLGAELFLSRISIILVIGGLVILFWGWKHFQIISFPWSFLLLMIPVPAIVLTRVTFPLQVLTSDIAAAMLPLLGVPVLREGNVINLPATPLEVAEACSGIRSLLSLLTLSIAYGFVSEKSRLVRIVLALASVPIAVATNSVRIVITGLLAQYWNTGIAQGFFHEFSGWLIFILALGALILLHRLSRRLEARPSVC